MKEREVEQESAIAPTRDDSVPQAAFGCEARNGLQMAPEVMLELARQTAELLVERIEGLPE